MNWCRMNWQTFARHADVAAGVIVFLVVGRFAPAHWGAISLGLGVAAYFLVNRFYPPARG